MKKYLLILILLAAVIAVIFAAKYYIEEQKFNNLNEIKNDLTKNFNSQKGFDVDITSPATKISGKLDPTIGFTGVLQDENIELIYSQNSIYVQKDNKWQKEDFAYLYEMNILTHPNWIQLQKRLENKKIDQTDYLQYEIIFERPDQPLTESLSEEQKENLQIKGIILIDKKTLILKQLKVHLGKDTANEVLLEYTPINQAPQINIPAI